MTVELRVLAGHGRHILSLSASALEKLSERVFRMVPPASRGLAGEISVTIVGSTRMRELAHRRGKIHATDVLAFPLDPPMLGEIFLCPEEIAKSARQWSRTPALHARALFVHGLLHVLGYDHEREKDAAAMEKLEQKVLRRK